MCTSMGANMNRTPAANWLFATGVSYQILSVYFIIGLIIVHYDQLLPPSCGFPLTFNGRSRVAA